MHELPHVRVERGIRRHVRVESARGRIVEVLGRIDDPGVDIAGLQGSAPLPIYNRRPESALRDRYLDVVDAFVDFPNVLGFIVGNEVSDSPGEATRAAENAASPASNVIRVNAFFFIMPLDRPPVPRPMSTGAD